MELKKLRGRIIEKYGTCRAFSRKIKSSECSVSMKLAGKVGLSKEEIILWANALDLEIEQYGEYFFT